jgi:DNA-binding NtrC family response regulator
MSGVELAKALKAKRPESQIILTSAHPQGTLVMDSGWHFIPKPFLPQRLLEEVRKALSIPPNNSNLKSMNSEIGISLRDASALSSFPALAR